jgi:hypothetical protein
MFLVSAIVLSSLILVTLVLEATRSSVTMVIISAIWYHISEDGILHPACCFIP